jgi:hypothetical protein
VSLTYSEVTVAIAAPLTPRPSKSIKMASKIAFVRFPKPAWLRKYTYIFYIKEKLLFENDDQKKVS